MIISHRYRYLFVELPRTASTAISRELREFYGGERILRKHATYHDFLKIATPEEKQYVVFSCIRNPLDNAVSLYCKYRSDHKQKFSDPKKYKNRHRLADRVDMIRYRFIKDHDADFSTYFKRFYKIPYNDWSCMSHRDFDFVIRFENLQEDFARVLRMIGIEQVRPLPVVNRTGGKERDFLAYYTPDIIPHAKHIFGPYMQQWGYAFPPEWGDTALSWRTRMEFQFFNLFRQVYWRHLRSRI